MEQWFVRRKNPWHIGADKPREDKPPASRQASAQGRGVLEQNTSENIGQDEIERLSSMHLSQGSNQSANIRVRRAKYR
jgi:hypothetical protein